MGLLCLFVRLLNLNGMLWRLQVLLGQSLHRMLNSLLTYTPTATTTDVHACHITRELHVFFVAFAITLQSQKKSYPDAISCYECMRFGCSGALDWY